MNLITLQGTTKTLNKLSSVAHRIAEIRSLPFIVGCNPFILSIHELYIRAFHILNEIQSGEKTGWQLTSILNFLVVNISWSLKLTFICSNSKISTVSNLGKCTDCFFHFQVLRELLDDHKDVVSYLAQGFKECRKHIKVSKSLEG